MESVWESLNILPQFLSETTGAEISGVRLFCTLLYVYPVIIAERLLLAGVSANLHHLYHTATAAFLLYFNFGVSSGYFLGNVLGLYLILVLFRASKYTVILSIIFNMAYLTVGYAGNLSSAKYVVTWTTSHAVLTLKLIGISWDIYDGAQQDTRGKEETAVASVPTLIELLGFAYYPPGLMTGPQISFKKYKYLSEGLYNQYLHSTWSYGVLRLSTGIVLMVAYPWMASYLPTEYFYTDQFKAQNLLTKMVCTALWGQILLSRYIGVWMIAEASCIISGIAFNGKDEDGNTKWDGCTNILLYRFLSVTRSQHVIDSFHVSTNKWVFIYVYKRLKFLNSKHISQVASLVFLSFWHGLETGYAMCFFLEFIVISGEMQIAQLCRKKIVLKAIVEHPGLSPFITIFTKCISSFTLGCGLLAFEQLKYHKYMSVYAEMYYLTHIFYISFPLVYIALSVLLKTDKSTLKKAD